MSFFRRLRKKISEIKNKIPPSVEKYISSEDSSTIPDHSSDPPVGNSWDWWAAEIHRELKQAPMHFLRQPNITIALHPRQYELARAYLAELSNNPFARSWILPRLHELPVGDPVLCPFFPFASPVSIQHAYYCMLLKQTFNVFLPENKISHVLEIGGGYGNFCRLMRTWGYKGRYIIVDIPAMHSLQNHFLTYAMQEEERKSIEMKSLTDTEIWPQDSPSILIATFSLNEMPIKSRELLEEQYKNFDYLFIAYDKSFDNIDNIEYFTALESKLKTQFIIEHKKDRHRRAWFFICKRKNEK